MDYAMMRRLLSLAAAGLLLAGIAYGQALQGIFADTHHGGGATYTGVGDTLSGAKAHYGTIAYSAASRGSNMLNLCNVADVVCADVASDATTGLVSSSQTIGGVACGTTIGVDICTVKTAYDDSGASNCSGACNVTNTTIATRPIFIPSAIGAIPAIRCAGGANSFLDKSSGFTAITEPLSMGGSWTNRVDPGANLRIMSIPSSANVLLGANGSGSNSAFFFAGSVLSTTGTMTNGTFYAILGSHDASGSGGAVSINGSTTTGTVGTNDSSTGIAICNEVGGGSNGMDGYALELFVYPQTLAAGDVTALTSTMRTNGGF